MLSQFLSEPLRPLLLCGVIAVVMSFNMILFALLRGDRREQRRMAKWSAAFTGAQKARRRQAAELDELRRAVQALEADEDGAENGND
jgi:hypothetical protein